MNIPEFQTLEDMAEFWDRHEITDFEDELTEVTEPIFQHLQQRTMTLMLDDEHYLLLKRLAEQEHLNATALINEWVITLIEEKGKLAMGQ